VSSHRLARDAHRREIEVVAHAIARPNPKRLRTRPGLFVGALSAPRPAADRGGRSATPPSARAATSPVQDRADRCLSLCSLWLRSREEADVLQSQWGVEERALKTFAERWRLSRRERALLPEAATLMEIENALDAVEARVAQVFEELGDCAASSVAGVAAKLEVLRKRLEPEAEDDVLGLVDAAIDDLRAD
jgi:hypothetical protein